MLDYFDNIAVKGPAVVNLPVGWVAIVDATGGNVTINLPPSDGGVISVGVLRTDGSGNTVKLVASGGGVSFQPKNASAPAGSQVATGQLDTIASGISAVTVQNEIRTFVAMKHVWYYT